MRLSCNGCRVLRKGCSDACTIRESLEWIRSPDAQANATVFLAKFYGRTGLVNLINAGKPPRLRQAIFRSLLYEACGRIVNPVYGSVGLLESGKWQLCQDAVEAVLKGVPIEKIAASDAPALKGCDIRHVCKKDKKQFSGAMALNRVRPSSRFKRSGARQQLESEEDRSPSHGSTLSHQSAAAEITERESACRSSQGTDVESGGENDVVDIELDLSLGLGPVKPAVKPKAIAACGGACEMELGLHPQPS